VPANLRPPDEAFIILRRYARDHNHPLTQLASDVIRGTVGIFRDSEALSRLRRT